MLQHAGVEYTLAPLGRSTVDRALNLTQRHRLRGYDAIQLATALLVADAWMQAGARAPRFISADDDLLKAARAEGLESDNPINYG